MAEQKNHESLEALISEISFNIVEEGILSENEINKLLGVLSNDGVYAMWVYAIAKLDTKFKMEEQEICYPQVYKLINCIEPILNLVGTLDFKEKELKIENNKSKERFLKRMEKKFIVYISNYFQEISRELSDLLFLKQLLERTLIYARYHAKALEGSNE